MLRVVADGNVFRIRQDKDTTNDRLVNEAVSLVRAAVQAIRNSMGDEAAEKFKLTMCLMLAPDIREELSKCEMLQVNIIELTKQVKEMQILKQLNEKNEEDRDLEKNDNGEHIG